MLPNSTLREKLENIRLMLQKLDEIWLVLGGSKIGPNLGARNVLPISNANVF